MQDLIPIKKSHFAFYNQFELFHLSKQGEPLLYKKADQKLDQEMLDRNQYPQFYIKKADQVRVTEDLQKVLNARLIKAVSEKGLGKVREAVTLIVKEALAGPIDISLGSLPETVEILMMEAKKDTGLLESLISMEKRNTPIIEHSINVLSLTAQYCFSVSMDKDKTRELCLGALVHDVGQTRIDASLFGLKDRLTDEQYKEYQTHTVKGCEEIQKYPDFGKTVPRIVLEHHERIDGSGYPNQTSDICFEAQVIGLVDSYESLKYHEKNFRGHLDAYNALQIVKKDVVENRYNKDVFIDLCSCLIK